MGANKSHPPIHYHLADKKIQTESNFMKPKSKWKN